MKKSKRCAILVLTALMLLLLLLAGCGSEKSGNTISEPEIQRIILTENTLISLSMMEPERCWAL